RRGRGADQHPAALVGGRQLQLHQPPPFPVSSASASPPNPLPFLHPTPLPLPLPRHLVRSAPAAAAAFALGARNGAVREGGEDRGGHVRGGVQGAGQGHQRDDRAQEDPPRAGGRGRPVHRHPRDLSPQGDEPRQHRQIT
ncbi:cell division control protein2-like protein, partial [Zea mays]